MRRLSALPVLVGAVLLAGCQASGDSTSADGAKRSAGSLPAPRPDPITVPEGATLPLVLETAISSATSRSGDLVVARLAEDVRVGARVVVPAGTEVHGLVTAAVPSGRVKGLGRLAFDFDTLVLRGKEHSVGTRPAVDITAGIVALIGGATGTGIVLTNKGKEVVLGTGSRVTVRLTRETRL